MIFTASSLGRSQVSSQQFKDVGASSRAPCSVNSVKISVVNITSVPAIFDITSYLCFLVAAFLSGSSILFSAAVDVTKAAFQPDLVTRPGLAITFDKKPSEALVSDLSGIGFTAQTANRFKYYRGSADTETALKVTGLGADPNCLSPQGLINLNGVSAFTIINRILVGWIAVLEGFSTSQMSAFWAESKDDKKMVPLVERSKFLVTETLHGLPDKGYFFPYFDGLVLPDKSYTQDTIIHRFATILGTTTTRRATSIETISKGWTSLHNTTAGRALSHLTWCLEQATCAGAKVKLIHLNKDYAGVVIYGDGVAVLEGHNMVKPTKKSVLKEEIGKFMGHDSAITEIASILSECVFANGSEARAVEPGLLSSPRAIHNACRLRNIDSDRQNRIRTEVSRLRFRQVFWSPQDSNRSCQAFNLCIKGEFIEDVNAPFLLRAEALWTKDPILSVLSAFGTTAPSLLGYGSMILFHISAKCYEKVTKPGSLTGIPIFIKPLQMAAEDMGKVITDGNISFSHKGKDQLGRLRLSNIGSGIAFTSPEYTSLMNGLLAIVTKKKRAREEKDYDDKDEEVEQRRAGKKTKVSSTVNTYLNTDVQDMQVDDEDFFA